MPKSAKPDIPQFQSWDEVDGAGVEVLTCQAEINQAEAELKAEIAAAKEASKQAIQEPKRNLDLLLKGIEAFVEAHKTELIGRSRKLTHVEVGYRKRPPSVAARLKSFAKVIERVLSLGRKGEPYIRREPELDKQRILADWKSGQLTRDGLQELGVKIDDTSEDFFCVARDESVAEPDTAA